jgi:hypothetical protein
VVKNPKGVCHGVKSLTLNGEKLKDNLIPVDKLGEQNQVDVIMG